MGYKLELEDLMLLELFSGCAKLTGAYSSKLKLPTAYL